MRKADHTIVFGSQNAGRPSPASPPIPTAGPGRIALGSNAGRGGGPLSDDLVDERAYMGRPGRALAFAAVSLAVIGVAAAGTYFILASHDEAVATTTTTSAETRPSVDEGSTEPSPAASSPAPADTPPDLPWIKPEVDAVRDPSLPRPARPTPPLPVLPKALPAAELAPTARPEPKANVPPPTPTYAAEIPPATPAPTATAKEVPVPAEPSDQARDDALARSGYYRQLLPPPLTPAEVQERMAPDGGSPSP